MQKYLREYAEELKSGTDPEYRVSSIQDASNGQEQNNEETKSSPKAQKAKIKPTTSSSRLGPGQTNVSEADVQSPHSKSSL